VNSRRLMGLPFSQDSDRADVITLEATPVVHHSKSGGQCLGWVKTGKALRKSLRNDGATCQCWFRSFPGGNDRQ
jgi:hypothetical protein